MFTQIEQFRRSCIKRVNSEVIELFHLVEQLHTKRNVAAVEFLKNENSSFSFFKLKMSI